MTKLKFLAALGFLIIAIVGIIVLSNHLLEESSTQPITNTQPSKTPVKESIQDILAKAETVGPVKFDVVASETSDVNLPTKNIEMATAKIWLKKPYMKIDIKNLTYINEKKEIVPVDDANLVSSEIIHPDANYIYNVFTDMYDKIPFIFSPKLSGEILKKITENPTLKELGTTTYDGKLATIIEYSYTLKKDLITTKFWIWNEKGLPLKEESTFLDKDKNIISMTTNEYKNYIFEDIPDSIFEIPEDKIMDQNKIFSGGAQTPEEAYNKFVLALKSNDIDLVLKSFNPTKRGEYKKILENEDLNRLYHYLNNANLIKIIDLNELVQYDLPISCYTDLDCLGFGTCENNTCNETYFIMLIKIGETWYVNDI